MKRFLALIGLALVAAGCGGGGSIQVDPPVDTNTQVSSTGESLWPLTTGSRWTYRITDDIDGVFEKIVEVLGPETVPNSGEAAIFVKSVQAQKNLEERSWQQAKGGIVVRLREDDYVSGNMARSTTWKPGTIKSIEASQALNWTHQATVRELILDGSGGVIEDRDKTFTWKVTQVNATVTVPGGTFTNAIVVERDRPDKTDKLRTYWLVPGVGKVKETGERLEELLSSTIQ